LKKFLFFVMAAILDTGRHWQTQFWKGTTQGSLQQSLVEIGTVVSEEKIFFFISSPQKRGDEIKKKSSPLKLVCQYQPNFAEMILVWSPFKIVSVSTVLYPRWPPKSRNIC
jgi:hypothetical protein